MSTIMNKNLDYYLKLPYRVIIEQIPIDEGGGYCATIPELGKYALIADGETEQEARANLEEWKKEIFEDYLRKNIEIPEPVLLIEESFNEPPHIKNPYEFKEQIFNTKQNDDYNFLYDLIRSKSYYNDFYNSETNITIPNDLIQSIAA